MTATRFIVIIVSFAVFSTLSACNGKSAWQKDLATASKEHNYALLFINDGKNDASNAMRSNLQETIQNSSAQFQIVEANASKDKDTLLKFLKVDNLQKVPMTIVIAPNGAITGSFTERVTKETLERFLASPKEADVLLSLQKNQIVLLCLSKGQSSELEGAKTDLQAIGANYAGIVSVIYADLTDRKDAPLIEKLPPVNAKLSVLALAPTGQITARLEGTQINRPNLLKALQSCSSGCSSCAK